MSTLQTEFDQLEQELQSGGVSAVLDRLVERLREKGRYHELFEALKMRLRHQLGLPILYSDVGDELDESRRTQLEDGLLDACRQVGLALLRDGFVRDGWMYLRPVGERGQVADALKSLEVDEDNLDELIEVTLHEGVDPVRGYALVLEHHGTCNAITTYESVMGQHRLADQQAAAGLLVEHLHGELLATVRADVAQQEGSEPAEQTLAELVADRDWLFGEHSYHIDATHLASTVRFSRILADAAPLRLAVDLTEYGRRLNPQFQYQGEAPFSDLYPSHALYLRALLGEEVDPAIEYFQRQAAELDPAEHGTQPIEALVQLLDRVGRPRAAIEALIEFAAGDAGRAKQVVPLLLELSAKQGDFEQVMEFCRQGDDLLGFASGLVQARSRDAVE